MPVRLGPARALWLARALHVGTIAALAAVGVAGGLHPIYWAGIALIGGVLVHEHRLVRPGDLSRIGPAFFNSNAVVSGIYLVTVLATVACMRTG